MTCQACTDAETKPDAATFANGCRSCEARALAATGALALPREQYRDAVRAVFGDQAQAGHELIKQWGARLRQYRAAGAHAPAAQP